MAVQIFDKDGKCSYIEPERLQAHLNMGYSIIDPHKPKVSHPEVIYPATMAGIEELPRAEQEKQVLEAMGIIEIVHPVSTPPESNKKPPRKKRVKKAA